MPELIGVVRLRLRSIIVLILVLSARNPITIISDMWTVSNDVRQGSL